MHDAVLAFRTVNLVAYAALGLHHARVLAAQA